MTAYEKKKGCETINECKNKNKYFSKIEAKNLNDFSSEYSPMLK